MELGKKLASYVRDTMKTFRYGKGVVLRSGLNLSTQVDTHCVVCTQPHPLFLSHGLILTFVSISLNIFNTEAITLPVCDHHTCYAELKKKMKEISVL